MCFIYINCIYKSHVIKLTILDADSSIYYIYILLCVMHIIFDRQKLHSTVKNLLAFENQVKKIKIKKITRKVVLMQF